MKRKLWVFLISSFFFHTSFAQTSISGVINHYAKVTIIDTLCQSKLTVDDTTGFEVGMKVILIQMKGAAIDESNSSAFGDLIDLGSSGYYEKNEVDSISTNCIFLKYKFLHNYNVNGKVQLVSMPFYDNAFVTDTLTADPWNGEKGGILAFIVENDLVLNENIDVSGMGFRGGIAVSINPNNCNWLIPQNDYFYGLNNWRGAEKGEGAANIIAGKEAGKGAQFNGGGGGNDHNSGGGGGSNASISLGGKGGENNEPATFGCKGLHPGNGGKNSNVDSSRIYFGGGGGAGHGNNDNGTNGGNGGGIVILETGTITSNTFKIMANGQTPPDGGGDGAGGGGGGGTLILNVGDNLDLMYIEANGGNGGLVDNNAEQRCHGPGGGGGGGCIQLPLSGGSYTITTDGGLAGMSINSATCPDSNNGAENGTSGGFAEELLEIPQSSTENGSLSIENQPVAQIVCEENQAFFSLDVNGSPSNYQWQVDDGNGFQDINDGTVYSGTMTDSLTILDPTVLMSGWIYQCIVSNNCGQIVSDGATLMVIENANIITQPESVNICSGESNLFSVVVIGSNIQYQWQVDEGPGFVDLSNGPIYINVNTATLGMSTTIVLMNGNIYRCVISHDCGTIISETVVLTIETAPMALFNYMVNGSSVNFNNASSSNSISFDWDFGDNSSSTEINPVHNYSQSGMYSVQLIAFNNCGSDTITQEIEISFLEAPVAAFTLDNGTGCAPLVVQFTDQSTGEIDTWNWTFPGGNPANSSEQNPQIIYDIPGLFDVSLEVTNSGGSDVIIYEDYIFVDLPIFAGFTYSVNVNTVSFANTSQNAVTFEWDFGDNSPGSNEENPIHEYVQPGVYMVTLVATNPLCGSAITQDVEVFFTNVEKVEGEVLFEVFPNPVSDILSIKFLKNKYYKKLKLFNSNGQIVLENHVFNDETLEIDFSQYPQGMYLIEIFMDDKIFIEKIIRF